MHSDLPNLTPRLEAVASFVRKNSRVCDVGTDHAYIPVFLINSEICKSAVAGDVVPGPLERAKQTAKLYNATEKIRFVLCDGLSDISSDEADDIVIAGMGGELIAKILSDCPWAKDKAKHYILQPMTAQDDLRKYLCENGYKIEKETVVTEKHDRKIYTVMSVFFTGEVSKKDSLYYIAGEISKNKDKDSALYLKHKADLIKKKVMGLEKSQHEDKDEVKALKTLSESLIDLSKTIANSNKEDGNNDNR